MPKLKIVICSHGVDNKDKYFPDFQQWLDISLDNKKKYCDKHGYAFIFSNKIYDNRYISWQRIPFLLETMDLKDKDESPLYDWLFWVDIDTLITNTDILLEDFIDDNYDFIINKEKNSGATNFGVCFVKNSNNGRKILEDIYKQTDFLDYPTHENKALIHLFTNIYSEECLKRIRFDIDSIYNRLSLNHMIYLKDNIVWQDGDFIIHFAGYKNEEDYNNSLQRFRNMSKNIKY